MSGDDLDVTIRLLEDRFAQLGPSESYWTRRQQFLVSKGYTLRPRYRPDWVPSWKRDPKTSIFDADDRHSVPVKSIALHHRDVSLTFTFAARQAAPDGCDKDLGQQTRHD